MDSQHPRAWVRAQGNHNEFRYRVAVACNNLSIEELLRVAGVVDAIEDARVPARVLKLKRSLEPNRHGQG